MALVVATLLLYPDNDLSAHLRFRAAMCRKAGARRNLRRCSIPPETICIAFPALILVLMCTGRYAIVGDFAAGVIVFVYRVYSFMPWRLLTFARSLRSCDVSNH